MENTMNKQSTRLSLSSLGICRITHENKTVKLEVCCKTVCKQNRRLNQCNKWFAMNCSPPEYILGNQLPALLFLKVISEQYLKVIILLFLPVRTCSVNTLLSMLLIMCTFALHQWHNICTSDFVKQ